MRKSYFLFLILFFLVAGYFFFFEGGLSGRSIFPVQCSETDQGIDTQTFGSISVGGRTVFDYCLNSSQLFEYYCTDEGITGAMEVCPGACIDGACADVPPAPTVIACEDSDGGRSPELFGEITLTYNNKSQVMVSSEGCSGSERVLEMYCSAEKKGYTLERVYCPGDTMCIDGACTLQE